METLGEASAPCVIKRDSNAAEREGFGATDGLRDFIDSMANASGDQAVKLQDAGIETN